MFDDENKNEEMQGEESSAFEAKPKESGEYHGAPQEEFRRENIFRVPPETTSGSQGYSSSYGSYQQSAYQPPMQEQPKKKSGHGFIKAVALVLVCALVSALTCVGTYSFMDRKSPKDTKQVVLGSAETDADDDKEEKITTVNEDGTLTMQSIYSMACEQVVGVSTSVTTTNIFGQTSQSAVTGTGFIISEDGYILTNYHVIEYSVQYGYELNVKTKDNTTYTAEVIGYEADNDVAVIKIDATGLNAVTFGDSEKMQVGDQIYAVGNPLGELTYTMTEGIVSATNRIVSTSENVSINMFQISAAVNSGNSGGPVYNSKGEVLGIVSAKYSQSGVEGLGFAIPINDAYKIAVEVIENGYVSGKAYLGVNVIDVESYVSTYYNLPVGAYVAETVSGAAAEKAGIQKGDIITKVGTTEVSSVDELKLVLRNHSAGDTVDVEVYRNGETLTLSVTLDEQAPTQSTTQTQTQPQQSQQIPAQSSNKDSF